MTDLPGRRFDPTEDNAMLRLRAAGRSIQAIACEMQRPASSIQVRLDFLKTHGVTVEESNTMSKKQKPAETDMIDAMPEHDPVVEMATETMTGDLRDFILNRIRYEQDKRPWDERSEFDQRDTVARVEASVREVVSRAVEMLAAAGRPTIKATLSQVTVKDGIKGIIEMSKSDEQRHALIDSTGSTILIVVADAEDFTGERGAVAIKPDESDLVEAAAVVHSEANGAAETPFH